jgi:tetratricopeptide (TPR) repeat protein
MNARASVVFLSCALSLVAGCNVSIGRRAFSKSIIQSRQFTQQGIAALEHENLQQAELLLARAVQACKEDPEARRHYAHVLWRNGSRQEALSQLSEALRLAPENEVLYRELAEFELALGNLGRAQHLAEEALSLNHRSAPNWAVRAKVRQQAADPQQALADYHRSLSLDPHQPDVLLEVAELYRQLNQPRRALAALQTACDSYAPGEEPARVYYLMALASGALGRHDDAVAHFRLARQRGDASPDLLYQLAQAQLLAGHSADAEQTASELLARAPEHVAARALIDRIRTGQLPAETPQFR